MNRNASPSLASPLWWAAAVGLVLYAAVYLYHLRQGWQWELDAEIARIRAAGEPITVEDLYKFYSPSEEALAAGEEWLAACAFMETEEYKAAEVDVPFVGFTSESNGNGVRVNLEDWYAGGPLPNQEKSRAFLDAYSEQIDRLQEHSTRSNVLAFPIKWEDTIDFEIKYILGTREAALLLCLSAATAIDEGDAIAAADSLHGVFSICHAIRFDPFFVSQVARMGIDRQLDSVVQRAITSQVLSDEQLEEIERAFARRNYRDELRTVVLVERAMYFHWLQKPRAAHALQKQADITSPWFVPVWIVARDFDLRNFLHESGRIAAVLESEPPLIQAEILKWDQSYRALWEPMVFQRFPMAATIQLTPHTESMWRAGNDCVASARAGAVACAAERMRIATGEIPDSLRQIMEAHPDLDTQDPWTGEDVVYRRTENGALVYSLGHNGRDDDGVTRFANKTDYDVVFRIEPRERSESSAD